MVVFIFVCLVNLNCYLILQLLEPGRYTWLFKALYGLLMLLPQVHETLLFYCNLKDCITLSTGVCHCIHYKAIYHVIHICTN